MNKADKEKIKNMPDPVDGKITTTHSVVKIKVTRASSKCPVFDKGDEFFIRQHIIDSSVSDIQNFCYHSMYDLYNKFTEMRSVEIGHKEKLDCRDLKMVGFELERLPDETAPIGRGPRK